MVLERLYRKLHQQLLDAQAFRKGHETYAMELEEILKNTKSLACETLPVTRGTGEDVKVVGKIKYLSKVRPLEPSWKDHSGVSGGYKLLNDDTFAEVDELRLALSRKVTVLVRVSGILLGDICYFSLRYSCRLERTYWIEKDPRVPRAVIFDVVFGSLFLTLVTAL